MMNKVLSVLERCIYHIQLKFSDFSKSELEPGKIITERFTKKIQPHNINKGLVFPIGNHFELVRPICPSCGSNHAIKQEYYERNPILGEFGPQKIYLRRYLCKKCNKKFIISLNSVVNPKYRYVSVFKDGAASIIGIEYHSLKKQQKNSVYSWDNNLNETLIKNKTSSYSGYYCYDEEYIRINDHKCYRFTLYDSMLNISVSEEISDNLKYGTIFSFLKRFLYGKALYGITTDHIRMYNPIINKLGLYTSFAYFISSN